LRDEAGRQLLGGVSNGVFYQLKRGQKTGAATLRPCGYGVYYTS
jgi:hypothetical protein